MEKLIKFVLINKKELVCLNSDNFVEKFNELSKKEGNFGESLVAYKNITSPTFQGKDSIYIIDAIENKLIYFQDKRLCPCQFWKTDKEWCLFVSLSLFLAGEE